MIYYCNMRYKTIKRNSISNHLKSISHKKFDKRKHNLITIKKPDINKIDDSFYSYIIQHSEKKDEYLIK